MPEPAPDLVTDHRVTDRFRDDKAGARRGGLRRLIKEKKVDDQAAAAGPAATTNRCGEFVTAPQSLRRGQHDYLGIPA
jgi:hypothetical protein